MNRRHLDIIFGLWFSGLVTDKEVREALLASLRGEDHWILDTEFTITRVELR